MKLADYLRAGRGRSAELAAALGKSGAFISQMSTGGRPVPAGLCMGIEQFSAGAVRRWDMRPDDWHRIWPELVGAEGAPAVQAQEAA